MKRSVQIRYRFELMLSVLSGIALMLTVAVPDWIEEVLAVDPDRGSGATEWAIASGLLISTVVLTVLTRRDRRTLLNAR